MREFVAAIRRSKRTQDERAWLAWHTAVLGRQSTMPEFDAFIGRMEKQKPQTAHQHMSVLSMLGFKGKAMKGRPSHG